MKLGEIRMFAGQSIPYGWVICQGQRFNIAEYQSLFSLIGNAYGGDGINDFLLPNMQDTVPLNQGTGPGLTPRTRGEKVGVNGFEITPENAPSHNHTLRASSQEADSKVPGHFPVLAKGQGTSGDGNLARIYSTDKPDTSMSQKALTTYSKNSKNFHGNRMSSVYVNFIMMIDEALATPTYDPLIGEIRIFAFDLPRDGWLPCNGQLVSIDTYNKLYKVIGDGRRYSPIGDSFALPDFRASAPYGASIDYQQYLGQHTGGSNRAYGLFPPHTHQIRVDSDNSGAESTNDPEGNVLGFARFQRTTDQNVYALTDESIEDLGTLISNSVSSVGAEGAPSLTKNMQPFIGLNFNICYSTELGF